VPRDRTPLNRRSPALSTSSHQSLTANLPISSRICHFRESPFHSTPRHATLLHPTPPYSTLPHSIPYHIILRSVLPAQHPVSCPHRRAAQACEGANPHTPVEGILPARPRACPRACLRACLRASALACLRACVGACLLTAQRHLGSGPSHPSHRDDGIAVINPIVHGTDGTDGHQVQAVQGPRRM
jgi:hypothetical protein